MLGLQYLSGKSLKCKSKGALTCYFFYSYLAQKWVNLGLKLPQAIIINFIFKWVHWHWRMLYSHVHGYPCISQRENIMERARLELRYSCSSWDHSNHRTSVTLWDFRLPSWGGFVTVRFWPYYFRFSNLYCVNRKYAYLIKLKIYLLYKYKE